MFAIILYARITLSIDIVFVRADAEDLPGQRIRPILPI